MNLPVPVTMAVKAAFGRSLARSPNRISVFHRAAFVDRRVGSDRGACSASTIPFPSSSTRRDGVPGEATSLVIRPLALLFFGVGVSVSGRATAAVSARASDAITLAPGAATGAAADEDDLGVVALFGRSLVVLRVRAAALALLGRVAPLLVGVAAAAAVRADVGVRVDVGVRDAAAVAGAAALAGLGRLIMSDGGGATASVRADDGVAGVASSGGSI